jgi:hypothetical protein
MAKVSERDTSKDEAALDLAPDAWERFEAMTRKVMAHKVGKAAPRRHRAAGKEDDHAEAETGKS